MFDRRSLAAAIAAATLLAGSVTPAWADAASYIRTFFDATIAAPEPDTDCRRFAPLARFAAGQHWRQYDATDRTSFDTGFCGLVHDALGRLKHRYPDLALNVLDSHAGPRGMAWVRSKARAGGEDWPVDWLVGDPDGSPYLADLKIMGVSLAIMLRSLAVTVPNSQPATVIKPWRHALDLALPQ
ncbi:ABC transporter substrate-binding protein [Dongia sp.]|uniref:ABC transporter substrate-binding protein n=1 Tax=Dongia sp. TaxID=1977262 RepID=UPI0035AFEE57